MLTTAPARSRYLRRLTHAAFWRGTAAGALLALGVGFHGWFGLACLVLAVLVAALELDA